AKDRDAVVEGLQNAELKLAEERSQWDHLRTLAEERYHAEPKLVDNSVAFDLAQAPMLLEEQQEGWMFLGDEEKLSVLDTHLKALRDKESRYGEVNLTAINEFDEVQKRYVFLMQQRTDL